MSDLRDYGRPPPDKVTGRPKATALDPETQKQLDADGGCPNCGCFQVMQIEVEVEHRHLTAGKGICRYLGCPACPWASPALMVSA